MAHSLSGGGENEASHSLSSPKHVNHKDPDMSNWKTIDSRAMGLKRSSIGSSVWTVLNRLRSKGYEVYLVGGCVRDLLLKKIPKDFDVITTAGLKQIKKLFHRCIIIGKRFPICQVRIDGSVIEVSSFETNDACIVEKGEAVYLPQMPNGCDNNDFVRWRNCMKRDFTVNCLFYDPFINKVYDYANGIRDLTMLKVRTVTAAHVSFKEDSARILRGLRIAARLGLIISDETAAAMRQLSSSVVHLGKDRLGMEMNYLLSYGAAEYSFQLLREFKLLELLFPIHEAYLTHQTKLSPVGTDNMLLHLLHYMDKISSSDRPCHCSLWVGILAFHLALVNHPRDALVIWTFCLALYLGDGREAVKLARQKAEMRVVYASEISQSKTMDDEQLCAEVCSFVSSMKSSVDALTKKDSLLEAMERYPHSSCSGLVVVSLRTGRCASELLNIFQNGIESIREKRDRLEVDCKLLTCGDKAEVRFVLGRIIMQTMDNATLQDQQLQVACTKKQGLRMSSVLDDENERTPSTDKHPSALSSLFM
ncbi:Poly(A) polymerase I [Nymphaea thermarum]|nr:Poly(A) polymerase I [Nymphaea thermarum]